MTKFEDIIRRLKDEGLKLTPQRIIVLESLIKLNNHPTAEIIYEEIKKKYPNISLATVYNILELLSKKNIINKVYCDDGKLRYDGNTIMHQHIVDTKNGEIKDFYDDELNDLLVGYFRNKNINILDLKLYIKIS